MERSADPTCAAWFFGGMILGTTLTWKSILLFVLIYLFLHHVLEYVSWEQTQKIVRAIPSWTRNCWDQTTLFWDDLLRFLSPPPQIVKKRF